MFMELVLLLILLGTIYLIFDFIMRYNIIKYGAKIPGPISLPFIGNMLQGIHVRNNKDCLKVMIDTSNKYYEHGLFSVWMLQVLIIAVFEPSFIEIVGSIQETSTKGDYYQRIGRKFFNGVVVSPGGRQWKELRRPITHSMKNNAIENVYFKVMIQKTNDFIHFLLEKRQETTYEILNDFCALYSDLLSETHLGVPMNEVWERKLNFSEPFERYLSLALTALFRCGHLWYYILKLTKFASKVEKDRIHCLECMKWILHERERIRSENKQPVSEDMPPYYTDFLLQRQMEENLSEEQICLELADLVMAGSNTTSLFAASALIYLGMFPEIQEKAYQEQMKIFGDSDRDPTVGDINSMEYLLMVFKETIRHMGNPGVYRNVTNDFKLGKYTIPKGSTIFTFAALVHKDPKYWEKPNEFYPEHFLPEKEATRNRFAYNPFGNGIRMCAGKKYGTLSFMVAVSTVLRNFKISTPLKFDELEYGLNLFLELYPGYTAKFERRNKSKLHLQ